MSSCPVSLVSFVHESSELACKFSSSDQYKSYSELKQTKKTPLFEEHGKNFHEFGSDQSVLSQGLCY